LKSIITLLLLLVIAYILIVALVYFWQRSLLFYPVTAREGILQETISFKNRDISLHGWILNKGQTKAMIYFGGNSEDITNNIDLFKVLFKNFTVYLIDYRGYGNSQGEPTEQGLFSDAIAIYDQIQALHPSISLMGRSLGSGVAVYLASKRDIEQLFLLTPYDSIAELAQTHYPYLPARYLARDRFDSITYAKNIDIPVLIIAAELDRVVPYKHAEKLRDQFTRARVSYHLIAGARHNDVTSFRRYGEVIEAFIAASE
jgi:hypothetical protein